MNKYLAKMKTAAVLTVTSLLSTHVALATLIWTGASGTDLNWSTPSNWDPAGPPGPADDVQFLDAGATNDAVSINNIVSADATVQSILIGPTNGNSTTPEAFNTLIGPGVTLTVTSTNTDPATYMVGTPGYVAVDTTVTNTVTGAGGALMLDNASDQLIVREGNGSSGSHMAALDLSGLDAFSANLSSIQVGVGNSSYRRAVGTMLLARTNTIKVTGSEGSPGIFVGDNSGNNNGNGSISYFELGQQNDINADYIRVGGQKQQGLISFNTNLFSNSSLVLRGSGGGTNRVAYVGIGDEHHQGSSGNPTTGNLDLSGGTADILADTMYVGRSQTGSGQSANGFLTMSDGTLDVNTLEIGYEDTSSSSRSYTVAGTAKFNGTKVVVNNLLRLGRDGGATPPQDATLNLNGGSVDVNGAFAIEGVADISVSGGGVLNLPPGSALLANSVTVDGGAISNVDILQASNSLSIVNGGVITSPTVFDMGDSGLANWDVSSLPGGGVTASNQFSGAGYFTGNLTMAPSSVLIPGEAGGVNALNLNNNLTLNGATLRVDLSNSGLSGNDTLYVFGNLTLGATNDVQINALNGGLDTLNPYTLINYYGTLTGDQTDFQVAGPIAQSRYTFTFSTGTANAIKLLIGGTGAANLLWAGDSLANTWDLKTTANWNNGGSPGKFYNLDNVTFDDTGSASPAINLAGTLVPGSIVMSNNTSAYVFAGSGALAGGSVTNYGAGGLTISNDGTNDFNVIDVESGNLTLAGNSANTSAGGLFVNNYLGVGTVSATIANTNANDFGATGIVLNNGALIFDQRADATLFSPISGFGTVIKQNTDTLTLSGDNSGLSSPITVMAGTLKAGSGNVAGSGGLIVTNGGALDVNGADLHTLTVTASGAGPDGTGAIVNSGPQEIYAFGNVVLAGDTTFGGTGRWDIRSGADSLSVNNMGYNITKVGTNQVAFVGTTVDSTLGNVDVQEGQLSIQTSTTAHGGFGDPTKAITVHSNAVLETWGLGGDTTPLDKVIVLQDGAMIQNDSSASTISGTVTLKGDATFIANALFTFNNAVGGSGGLTEIGGSTLLLSGANTYSGATVVSNGTLQVDGVVTGTGVDVAGGTLSGVGSVTVPVMVETNGTLSPGDNAMGAMSIAADLTLSGTTVMDADKTGGVFTSDLVTNIAHLTVGGTLTLNLTGDALTNGDSFTLFSAASTTGSFAAINPATPGAGLRWEFTDGVLKVVTAATPPPTIGVTVAADGNVIVTGTNGPPSGTYLVLTSTNVALPLSSWTPVETNQFDSNGAFNFTNAASGQPQQFFIIKQQ